MYLSDIDSCLKRGSTIPPMITNPPTKTIIARICCILVLAVSASATNYTVKSGGGGSYTTIQACANVAVAGDTCTVFAGSYAGWTQTNSGSAGAPITFTVNPGDTVYITGTVTVTNTSYVTIGAPDSGGGCANGGRTTGAGGANPSFNVGGCFVFQNAGIQGPQCASGNHTNYFHFTYNTSEGASSGSSPASVINFMQGKVNGTSCGTGGYVDTTSSNNYIAHNDVNWNLNPPSAPFCNYQFLIYGNNNLLEYNDVQGTGAQHFRVGGNYNVVRFNYAHDDNGDISLGCGQSPEHIDFLFQEGGDEPSLSYSLMEKNVWENCSNDSGNCKLSFARADANDAYSTSSTVVVRYNYGENLDGNFGGAGDNSDGSNTTPNWHSYNNTVATGSNQTNSGACGTYPSGVSAIKNNICYNTQGPNGWSPLDPTSGGVNNGDMVYNTTCTASCTWNDGGPWYVNEATYSRLANQNPNFANFPTDGTVSSGSRALVASANGGGVALTTVSSGCGTNSLVVGDASYFQAGYGPANAPVTVPSDWISVGASSNTVQITAVNWSTNTLTLSNSISCSAGDNVNLSKDTAGNTLLSSGQSVEAVPDVGAYPSGSSSSGAPSAPNAPTGLTAVVK